MAAWDWKILADRVSKWGAGGARPLADYTLFVIQHVLDDLYHLVNAFIQLGCEPEDISVIGIPYSSRREAGNSIGEQLKCRIELPSIFPFDGYVCALLLDALERTKNRRKRLIILEDGAYAVPQTCQLVAERRADPKLLAGAVEQTSRGVRLDRQVAQAGLLAFPVISIPDCETKSRVEPPYIAEAVYQNLVLLMNAVNPEMGLRQLGALGMFGYGTIGDRVAASFGKAGVRVYVTDVSPKKRYGAYLGRQCLPLTDDRIGECDLILGATGSTSIGREIFTRVKPDAILASTSSRQVEIDMEWLSAHSSGAEIMQPYGGCALKIPAARRFHYSLKGGSKSVVVLYDGYPLNFWGRSLPDHVGDAILSLLLEGVLTVATGRFHKPDINLGGTVLEDADIEISSLWGTTKPPDGIDPFAA